MSKPRKPDGPWLDSWEAACRTAIRRVKDAPPRDRWGAAVDHARFLLELAEALEEHSK